jgi:hypothetical protein
MRTLFARASDPIVRRIVQIKHQCLDTEGTDSSGLLMTFKAACGSQYQEAKGGSECS